MITFQEVKTAIRCLKDNNAAGTDEIPSEIKKKNKKKRNLLKRLGILFNQCFALGKIPDEWKSGIITPVINTSATDNRDPSSYRGITITPSIYKVYCNILNSRLMKWESENGFRKGSCPIANIDYRY